MMSLFEVDDADLDAPELKKDSRKRKREKWPNSSELSWTRVTHKMASKMNCDELRPGFSTGMSAQCFDNWYWAKEDLIGFCGQLGLAVAGSKALLRQRVMGALPGGKPIPSHRPVRSKAGCFDWANSILTGDTEITQSVSFGPNFRNFMKAQIGARFHCHGDFMGWVKDNPGRTLNEAVVAWRRLETRKKTPGFRREIAAHNNYLRYLRDFQDHNPGSSHDDAKTCWQHKKLRPAKGGYVAYEQTDLGFL